MYLRGMRTLIRFEFFAVGLLLMAAPAPANAQAVASCDAYTACALSVVPRWTGVAVLRGEQQTHVATLRVSVFRSLDPDRVFAGDSLAVAFGRQSLRSARTAAVLSHVGTIAMLVAVVRADDRGFDDTDGALMISGAVVGMVSVPFQLRASRQLVQAAWTYNRRFAAP
jgi:hypothetical protein